MKEQDQDAPDLKGRTRAFALRIIRLCGTLPKTNTSRVLGSQVLRSGTSVGAHYREACRAKSNADFVSKIQGAMQELDETQYWLELLVESGIVKASLMKALMTEADELLAIFYSIQRTVKGQKR